MDTIMHVQISLGIPCVVLLVWSLCCDHNFLGPGCMEDWILKSRINLFCWYDPHISLGGWLWNIVILLLCARFLKWLEMMGSKHSRECDHRDAHCLGPSQKPYWEIHPNVELTTEHDCGTCQRREMQTFQNILKLKVRSEVTGRCSGPYIWFICSSLWCLDWGKHPCLKKLWFVCGGLRVVCSGWRVGVCHRRSWEVFNYFQAFFEASHSDFVWCLMQICDNYRKVIGLIDWV